MRRTVVVTGSASGIGAATAVVLRSAGDTVIGVDLRDAEVVADLATPDGRRHAVDAVLEHAGGRVDGVVCAAGLGPSKGRERTLLEVNFRGAVELLSGWRAALADGEGRAVVVGSNSTTTTPLVPAAAVRALLADDPDRAEAVLRRRGPLAPPAAYAASKIALTHWSRREAASPAWAGAGLRLNVLAPGAVMTPLLQEQLDGRNATQVERFPIPVGVRGTAEQLAAWAVHLLSPAVDYMTGAVVVVDGGTDALLRSGDWPQPLPLRRAPALLRAMRARR